MPEMNRGNRMERPELSNREKMYMKIEQSVLLIRDFYHEIQDFQADLTEEEVSGQLDKFVDRSLEVVGEEAMESYRTMLELQQKRLELDERARQCIADKLLELDELSEGYAVSVHTGGVSSFKSEEARDLFFEIEEEKDGVDDQIYDLSQKDGVNSIILTKEMAQNLKNKYQKIRDYENDTNKVIQIVENNIGEKLNQEDIHEIRFKAFEVVVVINRAIPVSDEKFKTIHGLHLPAHAISIVALEDPRKTGEIEEVVVHEGVHNMFADTEFMEHVDPSARFSRRFQSYERMKALGAPPPFLRTIERSMFRSTGYLNDVREEFLAELLDAERLRFGDIDKEGSEGLTYERLIEMHRGPLSQYIDPETLVKFDSLCKVTSTAGVQSRSFMRQVAKMLEQENDSTVAKGLHGLIENYTKDYVEMGKNAKVALDIGVRLSEEADQFAHFLLVSLKPKQYKYTESILRHRYGDKEVDKVQESVQLANIFSFRLEDLKKFKERVDAGAEFMFADKNIFDDLEEVEDRIASEVINIELETLADLSDYNDLMKWLGEKYDVDLEDILDTVNRRFFQDTIEEVDYRGGDVDVNQLWQELNDDQKEVLRGALDREEQFVYTNLSERLEREFNAEDVKKTAFWKAVKLVGEESLYAHLLELKKE